VDDITVQVPDGEINVWHRQAQDGHGTAVLVHGLSGNSRWWLRVLGHLPPELGVIALDVRGRGLSADAPPPYDLATIAADIERSLDSLGVGKAVVAGYSMGAWIAALFAVHHPERVERVVLVDGGLPLPRSPGADPERVIQAVVGPSLARFEMRFDTEEAFFDYWRSHPALAGHWEEAMRPALSFELERVGDQLRIRANPEAIDVSAREITIGVEASRAVPALDVDTLLLVVERGTADQPPGMIPLEVAEGAAADNPHLRVQYLPGLNHYTLMLGPGCAEVAAAVASPG
jgi:pimeloyl-ACP methyl ester carboxylesterase